MLTLGVPPSGSLSCGVAHHIPDRPTSSAHDGVRAAARSPVVNGGAR